MIKRELEVGMMKCGDRWREVKARIKYSGEDEARMGLTVKG